METADHFAAPYTEFVKAYDRRARSKHVIAGALAAVHAEIGGAILELCCGTGNVILRLAGSGVRCVGVDVSTPMLLQCRRKCRALDLCNLLLIQADIRSLGFRDSCFGVIFITSFSINYLCEPREIEQLFQRVAGWLAPDGAFYFDYISAESVERHFSSGWVEFEGGRMSSQLRRFERDGRYEVVFTFEGPLFGSQTQERHFGRAFPRSIFLEAAEKQGLVEVAGWGENEVRQTLGLGVVPVLLKRAGVHPNILRSA